MEKWLNYARILNFFWLGCLEFAEDSKKIGFLKNKGGLFFKKKKKQSKEEVRWREQSGRF